VDTRVKPLNSYNDHRSDSSDRKVRLNQRTCISEIRTPVAGVSQKAAVSIGQPQDEHLTLLEREEIAQLKQAHQDETKLLPNRGCTFAEYFISLCAWNNKKCNNFCQDSMLDERTYYYLRSKKVFVADTDTLAASCIAFPVRDILVDEMYRLAKRGQGGSGREDIIEYILHSAAPCDIHKMNRILEADDYKKLGYQKNK
jgi:hypothetical protein